MDSHVRKMGDEPKKSRGAIGRAVAHDLNVWRAEDHAMYEPQYEDESGGGGFVIGLLCGAALGAAVGLMFAPKTGSELRRTLYDSTGDIRKRAADAYGQASQTVNDVVAKGREAFDRGRQAYDSARENAMGQSSESFNAPRTSDFTSGTRSTTGA